MYLHSSFLEFLFKGGDILCPEFFGDYRGTTFQALKLHVIFGGDFILFFREKKIVLKSRYLTV